MLHCRYSEFYLTIGHQFRDRVRFWEVRYLETKARKAWSRSGNTKMFIRSFKRSFTVVIFKIGAKKTVFINIPYLWQIQSTFVKNIEKLTFNNKKSTFNLIKTIIHPLYTVLWSWHIFIYNIIRHKVCVVFYVQKVFSLLYKDYSIFVN